MCDVSRPDACPLWQELSRRNEAQVCHTGPAAPKSLQDASTAPAHQGTGAVGVRGGGPQADLPSCLNSDFSRSRFSCEMVSSGICLGQTSAHSPMLVQAPKPSASCVATMFLTRR